MGSDRIGVQSAGIRLVHSVTLVALLNGANFLQTSLNYFTLGILVNELSGNSCKNLCLANASHDVKLEFI